MKNAARFLAIGFSVTGIGLVLAQTADAGDRAIPANVVVFQSTTDKSGYAYGALGDVRNSGDGNEDIGCLTWLAPGAGINGCNATNCAVGCSATNATGTLQSSCWASSSFLGQAALIISSLTSDSYLYFSWDTNGQCSGLWIYGSSSFQPKRFDPSAP